MAVALGMIKISTFLLPVQQLSLFMSVSVLSDKDKVRYFFQMRHTCMKYLSDGFLQHALQIFKNDVTCHFLSIILLPVPLDRLDRYSIETLPAKVSYCLDETITIKTNRQMTRKSIRGIITPRKHKLIRKRRKVLFRSIDTLRNITSLQEMTVSVEGRSSGYLSYAIKAMDDVVLHVALEKAQDNGEEAMEDLASHGINLFE